MTSLSTASVAAVSMLLQYIVKIRNPGLYSNITSISTLIDVAIADAFVKWPAAIHYQL